MTVPALEPAGDKCACLAKPPGARKAVWDEAVGGALGAKPRAEIGLGTDAVLSVDDKDHRRLPLRSSKLSVQPESAHELAVFCEVFQVTVLRFICVAAEA